MLALATDENSDNDMDRGVMRRARHADAARVQDAGLAGTNDPAFLEWPPVGAGRCGRRHRR